MPASEAQRRATAKYVREKVVQKQVRFYPKDADLVEWVESIDEPFSAYVRRLIRDDMERGSCPPVTDCDQV
ncbi:hypothetical protein [Enorma phocaeensis]|uniref:hypothetical protein n=1 Tax=Enorma phocaeensis TaxID=1871019 RepID=UPI0019563B1C|nr:hypothetical protein [Enorma phocaeensis]MBM6953376.1 hypothetical protein [Enorma phocaeensis]